MVFAFFVPDCLLLKPEIVLPLRVLGWPERQIHPGKDMETPASQEWRKQKRSLTIFQFPNAISTRNGNAHYFHVAGGTLPLDHCHNVLQ